MEQSGSRPITGQEKRIIVQNFAHFQQFSPPGAKGNTFARIPEKPRCEAACVLCQRKNFIGHRFAGCSPRARPQTCARSPPVDPSWTCRCTARLAHHKASLLLFKGLLAEVAERPCWESGRRPGLKAPVFCPGRGMVTSCKQRPRRRQSVTLTAGKRRDGVRRKEQGGRERKGQWLRGGQKHEVRFWI